MDERKGLLSLTRKNHQRVGSSSPIPLDAGDDIPWGETMSPDKLRTYYKEQLRGLKKFLKLDKKTQTGIKGLVDSFSADLPFLEKKE